MEGYGSGDSSRQTAGSSFVAAAVEDDAVSGMPSFDSTISSLLLMFDGVSFDGFVTVMVETHVRLRKCCRCKLRVALILSRLKTK